MTAEIKSTGPPQRASRRTTTARAWLAFVALVAAGWFALFIAFAAQWEPEDAIEADGVSSFCVAIAISLWMFAWWSVRGVTFQSRVPLLVLGFTSLVITAPALILSVAAYSNAQGWGESDLYLVAAAALLPTIILASWRLGGLRDAEILRGDSGSFRATAAIALVVLVGAATYGNSKSEERPYAMEELERRIEDREAAKNARPPHPMAWWSTLANKGADMQRYLHMNSGTFPDISTPAGISEHDHFKIWNAAPPGAMLTGASFDQGRQSIVLAGYDGTWLMTHLDRRELGGEENHLACKGRHGDRFAVQFDNWYARDTGKFGCSSAERRQDDWCELVSNGDHLVPKYDTLDRDIARRANKAIRLADQRAIVRTDEGVKRASVATNVEVRQPPN